MASMGGNLRQRTRCAYLRDGVSPCNKREPGSGCAALDGLNRGHAILGTSEHCIATHPSDVAVALVAFDAVVAHASGPTARARSPIDDFFLLPGETPERRAPARARRADRRHRGSRGADRPPVGLPEVPRPAVLRVRARLGRGGARRRTTASSPDARLALGGVGTKPWRARRAEAALVGAPADRRRSSARPRPSSSGRGAREHNAFKVELAQRAMVRASRGYWRRPCDERVGTPITASTAARRSPARRATRPRSRCPACAQLAIVGATIACGRVTAIDAEAALRVRRRAGRAHPREPAEDRRRAAAAAVAARRRPRPARASSRCRTTSCTTPASRWRSSSPTRTSARSTPPRSCASPTSEAPVGRDDRRGPRLGLRGRRGCSAGCSRPQRARRRRGGAGRGRRARRRRLRMAANHHNPMEAPATVADWEGEPADARTTRRWACARSS